MLCTRSLLAVLAAALVWPAAAQAIQFDPPGTARLHLVGGSGAGAEFDTDGPGVGGDVSYDSGTGILTITGALDTLNYYDTADGACPTEGTSNCAFNFSPDLDITFTASYHSLEVNVIAGTIVEVVVNFESTGGVDLTLTDSTDLGFGSLLEAELRSGTLDGTEVTGLSASVFYNTATGTALTAPSGQAVMEVDSGTNYSSLFEPSFFGVALASISAVANGGVSGGTLDDLIGDTIAAGTLQSFTAETEGQVFNTAAGAFVPEPSLAALMGLGLGGWALAGRRRSRG